MGWGTRTAAAAAACCTLAVPASSDAANAPERSLVEAVNDVREARHLAPLRGSRALRRSAGRYARWMLRADFFGHQDRIPTTAPFRRLGENLAIESGRRPHARAIVRAWMRSPAHRALMLSRAYGFGGAGMARGAMRGSPATTWVLHVGG